MWRQKGMKLNLLLQWGGKDRKANTRKWRNNTYHKKEYESLDDTLKPFFNCLTSSSHHDTYFMEHIHKGSAGAALYWQLASQTRQQAIDLSAVWPIWIWRDSRHISLHGSLVVRKPVASPCIAFCSTAWVDWSQWNPLVLHSELVIFLLQSCTRSP